ncbi:MAG: winged helix-turn-helix transcriptional regulator [Spirochaetales bacterium]|nr:winged helix-turn-helix transcriptional regulator [Spirochaetales bacterium]
MIANAVCHRSYLKNSCVQVAIYDDRLEVSSPGGLSENLTIKKIIKGQSRIRNRAIAAAFHYMHLIENWGTGMPKILRESRQYGLKDPEIVASESDFRISLYRREFDFDRYGVVDPRERGNKVSYDAGNEAGNDAWKRIEASNEAGNITDRIIEIIRNTPEATTDVISRKLELSRSTVQRNIRKLMDDGRLVREGATKNGRWRVV